MSRKTAFIAWLILNGILVALILVYTNLAPFLMLEAAEGLPVIIYSGIFSFVALDLLVPNPRVEGSGSSGLMWLYWESMEHLAFPLLLLGFSVVFSAYPVLFQLSMITVMILLYGFAFGKIRTEGNLLKIMVLVNLLLAFWWLPTAVMYIDYAWGLRGILTWSLLSAVTILSYVKAKGRMKP